MYKIKQIVEWKLFGVCASIGARLGVSAVRIRLWFIYLSFITMGSPIILYMVLTILRNLKTYLSLQPRNPLKWQ